MSITDTTIYGQPPSLVDFTSYSKGLFILPLSLAQVTKLNDRPQHFLMSVSRRWAHKDLTVGKAVVLPRVQDEVFCHVTQHMCVPVLQGPL